MMISDSGLLFEVTRYISTELSVDWVDPRGGLSWVGNGSDFFVLVGCFGSLV